MSPRQNRVAPTGEIVAIPIRGGWMGNRGILHDDAGRVVRNHASSLWITCALSFKGWRAAQWQPHHYTVLFFHDEAISLAAGHRPCALCRREAYDAYRSALADHDRAKPLSAKEIDARLHAERLAARSRTRRRYESGTLEVLTPPASVAALRAGYVPQVADLRWRLRTHSGSAGVRVRSGSGQG